MDVIRHKKEQIRKKNICWFVQGTKVNKGKKKTHLMNLFDIC